MKVKIVKEKNCWYRDKVGEIYEVEPNVYCNQYKVISDPFRGYNIDCGHCEIVTDPVKIPFTFAAWDKDRSQKVWTRDGREVSQLTYFETPDYFKLIGVIGGSLASFKKNGSFCFNESESHKDLFLEHQEKEYWVNIYTNKECIKFGTAYDSEQEAKDAFVITEDKYLKTISFKA